MCPTAGEKTIPAMDNLLASIARRPLRLAAALAVAGSLAAPLAAQAAPNTFMTINDPAFKDTSGNAQFPTAIPIKSWSWSAENPRTPGSMSLGAGGGSKMKFGHFDLTKDVDATTPAFLTALGRGSDYRGVDVTVTSGDGPKAARSSLDLCLDYVYVTNDAIGHNEDQAAPLETVELAFGSVVERVSTPDGKRGIPAGWTIVGNSPLNAFSDAGC
jgi:type VI protein secretion system component Hcp